MRRFVVINGGLANTANTPVPQEIRTMKKQASSSMSDTDRDEIVQMIDWGWSDDQILQMLPHIERGSITAYRAHVTRGTYDNEQFSNHDHVRHGTSG
jgi:hypothetical protein